MSTGYYNNPETTAATFNQLGDGFVASGDIGRLNEDGSLSIIDRKKNLFKLAQGEYIALEYIETVYGRTQSIAQVWVWGDPLENFLCGIVVPNWEVAEPLMRAALGASCPADRAGICQSKEAKQWMLQQMEESANKAKLISYQRVKTILLEPTAWTIEKNQLTPTFKLRRTELVKTYSDKLKELVGEYKVSHSTHTTK